FHLLCTSLLLYLLLSNPSPTLRILHSFPTRRSSDLDLPALQSVVVADCGGQYRPAARNRRLAEGRYRGARYRPSASRRFRAAGRSEEHTSELQSRGHLVCRLLLEKKKKKTTYSINTV